MEPGLTTVAWPQRACRYSDTTGYHAAPLPSSGHLTAVYLHAAPFPAAGM